MACLCRGGLNRGGAAKHDEIGHRHLPATGGVKARLHTLKRGQNLVELDRLIDIPVTLRRQANAATIGTATLVRPTEGRGRSPCSADKFRHRKAGFHDACLQRGNVTGVYQLVICRRDRVLPDQILGRNLGPDITRFRPHITVCQLEPGTGEGIGKRIQIGMKATRDLFIGRVGAKRDIGCCHHRRVTTVRIMRVGNQAAGRRVSRRPLIGTGRALCQLPLIAEQHVEITIVPLDRIRRPGTLEATCDGVNALAALEVTAPAKTLFLNAGTFRLGPDKTGITGAMTFAKGVTAGNKRHCFLVIHRHAGEGFADVASRRRRIGLAVGAFRIYIDQAHLHGGKRVFKLAVASITLVIKPGVLGAPVDILFRLPHILATTRKTKGLETHRFQRAVTGEDHQVGPGQALTIFLLDRPQQAACLVEIGVVGPAVERREPKRSRSGATAAVTGAISTGTVPCHADEERAIMPVIGRPPFLCVGHQGEDFLPQHIEVNRLESLGIAVGRPHRVRQRRILMQDLQVQLIRPPVPVRPHTECGVLDPPVHHGAFVLLVHPCLRCLASRPYCLHCRAST